MRVLFDGDSITDCFRTNNIIPNDFYSYENDMGLGFPHIVKNMMNALGIKDYEFKNTGVSGDTTQDLINRLDNTLKFKPDFYILMIGINDVWRHIDSNIEVSNAKFEENYRMILSRVSKVNPNVKFLVQTISYMGTDKQFIKEVEQKNEIINKVADEYNCLIIDSNKLLTKEIKESKLTDWYYEDAVHYNSNAHMLIAQKILPYLL